MEVALAILAFIAICAGLMVWDYYKPARFRTTYSNVDKDKRNSDTGGSGGWFEGDGGD